MYYYYQYYIGLIIIIISLKYEAVSEQEGVVVMFCICLKHQMTVSSFPVHFVVFPPLSCRCCFRHGINTKVTKLVGKKRKKENPNT